MIGIPRDVRQEAREVAGLLVSLLRDLHRLRGEETGITMSQLRALVVLRHQDGCGMSDLARQLDISLPAATGLADRLEAQELVRRSRDPGDRRRTCLTLTPEGRGRLERIVQYRQEQLWEACATLSPGDLAALKRGLTALRRIVAPAGVEGSGHWGEPTETGSDR